MSSEGRPTALEGTLVSSLVHGQLMGKERPGLWGDLTIQPGWEAEKRKGTCLLACSIEDPAEAPDKSPRGLTTARASRRETGSRDFLCVKVPGRHTAELPEPLGVRSNRAGTGAEGPGGLSLG